MSEILQAVLPLILNNLEAIMIAIGLAVTGFTVKGERAKADARASVRTAIESLWRSGDGIIEKALADGKITADEWVMIRDAVGPQAFGVATKGGAKVLKRWLDKNDGSVALKYAREAMIELGEGIKPSAAAVD